MGLDSARGSQAGVRACDLPVIDYRKKENSKFQAKLKARREKTDEMFRAQSMHMPGPKLLYKAGYTWRPAIAWMHCRR